MGPELIESLASCPFRPTWSLFVLFYIKKNKKIKTLRSKPQSYLSSCDYLLPSKLFYFSIL